MSRRFTVPPIVAVALVLAACEESRGPTDPAPPTVSVAPGDTSIHPSESLSLVATVLGADGEPIPGAVVSWSINNPGIAQLEEDGLEATLVPEWFGSVRVRASYEGAEDTADVTIRSYSMWVRPDNATVLIGDETSLTASYDITTEYSTVRSVRSWVSSDTTVARVRPSDDGGIEGPGTGIVTAVGPGTATITAVAAPDLSATATIVVPEPPPLPVDSSRIYFLRRGGDYVSSVRFVRADGSGSGEVQSEMTTDHLVDADAAAGMIAYSLEVQDPLLGRGPATVVVIDTGGMELDRFRFGLQTLQPTIHPAGDAIAFTVLDWSDPPNRVVGVADIPADSFRVLASGHSPAWSPDGDEVAFVRDNQILRIPVNGGAESPIATLDLYMQDLDWSPDGTRLIFTASTNGTFSATDVYVIGVDGTGLTRLTDYSGFDAYPSWSPAGDRFAFLRDVDIAVQAIGDTSYIVLETGRGEYHYDYSTTWMAD